jgi:hypothetical protein
MPFRNESRCMLFWRLGGKRGGLGAMAIGAVRGTAQWADMMSGRGFSPKVRYGVVVKAPEDVTRREMARREPRAGLCPRGRTRRFGGPESRTRLRLG